MSTPRPLIVRTQAGIASDVPPAVQKKVEELIGRSFTNSEFRSIVAETQHYVHFTRRIAALHKGAELLLDSLDIQGETRKKLAAELATIKVKSDEEIQKTPHGSASPIQPYQDILIKYTSQLKNTLIDQALIPKSEVVEALGRAEEYASLAEGRPPLCTISQTSEREDWVIQLETPQDPLSDKKKGEFLNVVKLVHENKAHEAPAWFKLMPEVEKELFITTFKDAKNINDIADKAATISSKLRSIPGVANFSRHSFVVMTQDGTILTEDSRLRSSMVSSRDLPKDATGTRHELTEHNVQQIIDAMLLEQVTKLVMRSEEEKIPGPPDSEPKPLTIPILMQTLITPFKEPDKSLFQDKEAVIAALKRAGNTQRDFIVDGRKITVNLEFISTNHPLNPGRFVAPTVSTGSMEAAQTDPTATNTFVIADKDTKEISKLIRLAKEFAHDYKDKKVDIAATALEDALKRSFVVSDRELYISALEELTTSLIGGIPYGSCVSGKDRKGLETMYADAMRLYFDIYGAVPPMSWTNESEKADRARFVKIFTDIYVTRHQHENAGQNAPGADGIKTPALYLPNDILSAIEKRTNNPNTHKECDLLATNNEVDKIKPKVSKFKKMTLAIDKISNSVAAIMWKIALNPQEVLKQQITPKASEPKPDTRSAEEKEIIGSIRRALPAKATLTTPTGIKKMIALIDKKDSTVTLHELGKICRNRLDEHSTRKPETTEIYTMIQTLARNSRSNAGTMLLAKNDPAFANKLMVQKTEQDASREGKPEIGIRMVK